MNSPKPWSIICLPDQIMFCSKVLFPCKSVVVLNLDLGRTSGDQIGWEFTGGESVQKFDLFLQGKQTFWSSIFMSTTM